MHHLLDNILERKLDVKKANKNINTNNKLKQYLQSLAIFLGLLERFLSRDKLI